MLLCSIHTVFSWFVCFFSNGCLPSASHFLSTHVYVCKVPSLLSDVFKYGMWLHNSFCALSLWISEATYCCHVFADLMYSIPSEIRSFPPAHFPKKPISVHQPSQPIEVSFIRKTSCYMVNFFIWTSIFLACYDYVFSIFFTSSVMIEIVFEAQHKYSMLDVISSLLSKSM